MPDKKTKRICPNGHTYYKSSDCPVCPVCEQQKKPDEGFLSLLAAPARRAITNAGIDSLLQLSKYSEADILKLHGMGKSSIPKLNDALKKAGLSFKSNNSK
jgi:hypothetical protein